MSELSPETRALLDLGRAGDDPGDDAVAQNRSKLALKLGVAALGAGTVAGSATHAAAATAASSWASGKVIALGTTLLLGLGGAAVGAYTLQSEPAAPVLSAVSQPQVRPAVPSADPVTPAPAPVPEAIAPAQPEPPARAVSPAPSVAAHSIQNELELIRTAQKHLHRGDARAALSVLAEHARRYPAGALSEEREASRVFALCGLGDVAGARKQAERFLRRAPNSPFAERVRASCSSAAR